MEQWVIIGGSVTGKKNLQNNIPCQDSNSFKSLNENWNIIVVSDGAGSLKNSQQGSDFITNDIIRIFEERIELLDSVCEETWRKTIISLFNEVNENLLDYSNTLGLPYKTFGATCILLLFSNKEMYVAHIGDGRAGFRTSTGEWHSAVTPFKGEYAGETVFFTSEIWEDTERYIQTKYFQSDIDAVVAISDGAESFSWETQHFNEKENKMVEINLPFSPFYNSNINVIKRLISEHETIEKISDKWKVYLTNGNQAISNEIDDKTIVIGILVHKDES